MSSAPSYRIYPDIPDLVSLERRLRERANKNDARERDVERYGFAGMLHPAVQLERLPYYLQAAFHSILDLLEGQTSVLREMPQCRDTEGVLDAFPRKNRYALIRPLEQYFEVAVRAQDSLWGYLQAALGLNAPRHSLDDLVRDISSGRLSVDQDIAETMQGYWSAHGETVRDYRNLSQHHFVPTSELRVIWRSAKPEIYLLLPNNPKEKSIRRLRYGEPPIDAIPFALNSFLSLYQLAFKFAARLMQLTGGRQAEPWAQEITFRGDSRLAGVPPIDPSEFIQELDRQRRQWDSEYGGPTVDNTVETETERAE